MPRYIALLFTIFTLLPTPLMGQISERAQGVRIFLNNGNPEQAIVTAENLLKDSDMSGEERMTLLGFIAQAEEIRTTYRNFENVKPAIHAIEVLLKEFPDKPQASQLRWKRAWLWWNGGNSKLAAVAARQIITKDQKPGQLRRAWLLLARIHIKQENYAYARSNLLQYGLQVEDNSREQATGMAWMGIVDQFEFRTLAAYNNLHTVFQGWPDIISSEPILYSAYVQLSYRHGNESDTLKLANAFIKQYINTPWAPLIRVIRADIHARHANSIPDAIEEYGVIANSQAETAIGLKAFIRKSMLQNRDQKKNEKLLPVMASIKKIADRNQLSLIEDEALLALARLWTRLEVSDSDASSSTTFAAETVIAQALHAYATAATSDDAGIANAAQDEGSLWLKKSVQSLLEKQLWMQAVTSWQQFPQLRPAKKNSQDLRFHIAHAMRMLMLFDHAEVLLNSLYKEDQASIRGQRTIMELARLWMERQDQDAVEKIMRWLNMHEHTLYRPEILATVARIQLTQQHVEAAQQTIKSVQADDIALEARADYWKTKAEIAEALSQWHTAAKAWGSYRHSLNADAPQGLLNQAGSLFAGRQYALARKLYQQVPENEQGANWQYHMGTSQIYSGEVQLGKERLQKLVDENKAGTYTALAKLVLAEQLANTLLGAQP